MLFYNKEAVIARETDKIPFGRIDKTRACFYRKKTRNIELFLEEICSII